MKTLTLPLVGFSLAAGLVCLVLGCNNTPELANLDPSQSTAGVAAGGGDKGSAEAPKYEEIAITPELKTEVDRLCGYCHAVPQPDHYPREAWRKEVEQGFKFHFASPEAINVRPPPMGKVIAFYEQQAPETIELPPASAGPAFGPIQFRVAEVPGKKGDYAVSHLNWTNLLDKTTKGLLVSDMRTGLVSYLNYESDAFQRTDIAKLANPAHAEICDLNQDGRTDVVVADLGSFPPGDHTRGSVMWLKRVGDLLDFEIVPIAQGLGRVADVQPADLDGDGDTDLMVAEFGWRETGRILQLINQGPVEWPRFELQVVDPRHGSIHVPTCDINRDGRTDYFALFGQEHETVELFLNDGAGGFDKQKVFTADRASYGSSGIFPVDLDGDGDLDLVYSNGDLFDDWYLRTYHAVHWLENRGGEGWAHHELGPLPGVQRAVAADLDSDGDMDVVAASLIPNKVLESNGNRVLDSLVWFEQASPGKFERHVLEAGTNAHAALALDDFDADGDIDMAVGNYSSAPHVTFPLVTVWWNTANETK